METNEIKVPRRILGSLLSSLSAGVVPRSGAAYIAVGRDEEINALADDLDALAEGGGRMRLLIGKYGSGKSFLMQLLRGYAMERDFVCADCDLSPERRICGRSGTGIATFRVNAAVDCKVVAVNDKKEHRAFLLTNHCSVPFILRRGKTIYTLNPFQSLRVNFGKDKKTGKFNNPKFTVDNMWTIGDKHPSLTIEIDK